MIYKLLSEADKAYGVSCQNNDQMLSFLFDPANTDYQQFKADVLAGAELQDADSNVMTQEEADAFVATLP